MWLEETLKSYPSILLMVSHSQDFLNGVCNNIIYMGQKKLTYYSGAPHAVPCIRLTERSTSTRSHPCEHLHNWQRRRRTIGVEQEITIRTSRRAPTASRNR